MVQKAGRIKFLESDPIELLKSGNYNRVPAIFGTNKQEGTNFFTSKLANTLQHFALFNNSLLFSIVSNFI